MLKNPQSEPMLEHLKYEPMESKIPKVVPLSEKVTMARGDTFPFKDVFKNCGFVWHPDIKDQEPMWICDPAMDEEAVQKLIRKIPSTLVEIRNVRRVFLFGE